VARQCRHAEARDLLAAVYGWFTEGYDIQAEANEETASQITPQSPSEKTSAAINTTRDVSCRVILRTERLRSRALR
jgi:hypothetical protein